MRPYFSQQQTSLGSVGTSVKCQKQTSDRQSERAALPPPSRRVDIECIRREHQAPLAQ